MPRSRESERVSFSRATDRDDPLIKLADIRTPPRRSHQSPISQILIFVTRRVPESCGTPPGVAGEEAGGLWQSLAGDCAWGEVRRVARGGATGNAAGMVVDSLPAGLGSSLPAGLGSSCAAVGGGRGLGSSSAALGGECGLGACCAAVGEGGATPHRGEPSHPKARALSSSPHATNSRIHASRRSRSVASSSVRP